MSETKLLEMTNITKAFASNVVLNGVNLSVDEGEVVEVSNLFCKRSFFCS